MLHGQNANVINPSESEYCGIGTSLQWVTERLASS